MGGITTSAPRRVLALLAAALLAAALAGCATARSGSTVHAGGVSADTYTAVVRALEANGIKVTSESSLRMTYGADRDHVTVTGGGMQQAKAAPQQQPSVASVQMRRVGGKWQIASVTGQY
ncbi:MAG TPA: hypothetical protein VGK50_06460 [Coriobacteriia bacterium]|jgi:ABC-type uncharacterized transport system auxiliary subunit